jgi:hypothetical protein
MNDIDIQISGDNSVLDLDAEVLFDAQNFIHIYNDGANPVDRLYINLPQVLGTFNWKANMDFAGHEILDLFVLLKNKTHIKHGEFAENIKNVLFTERF